jgi:hypothetical protein
MSDVRAKTQGELDHASAQVSTQIAGTGSGAIHAHAKANTRIPPLTPSPAPGNTTQPMVWYMEVAALLLGHAL